MSYSVLETGVFSSVLFLPPERTAQCWSHFHGFVAPFTFCKGGDVLGRASLVLSCQGELEVHISWPPVTIFPPLCHSIQFCAIKDDSVLRLSGIRMS